jgi:hypothetical protein
MSESSTGSAQSDEVPVIDTRILGKRLYADPQVITFGRKSLALDEVEWVSYLSTQTAVKRFMYPTTHENEWAFTVGTYPYYGGSKVSVRITKGGKNPEQPEAWIFLVNLARKYLLPRLLNDLVERVGRGETVTVGGSLQVSPSGIACPKPRFSVPWDSLNPAQQSNGMVWIRQVGAEKPLLTVPLSHPNASLIPPLFLIFGDKRQPPTLRTCQACRAS